MTKNFILPTADGFNIYGFHDSAKDNDKLLVLAHGLTGHPNEVHLQAAVDYFVPQGYDVVRFWFYDSGQPQSRTLFNSQLATYAQDLAQVHAHFAPNYAKSFVAGHSYGGLTLLLTDFGQTQPNALSFWDPSFAPYESFLAEETKQDPTDNNVYFLNDDYNNQALSHWFINEAKDLTLPVCQNLGAKMTIPCQVVLAGAEVSNYRIQFLNL